MQTSHRQRLILIEIPRCASASMAQALGMTPLAAFPRFATARAWRTSALRETPEFADHELLAVVRDPALRFVSAVAAIQSGMITADDVEFAGTCPWFFQLVDLIGESTSLREACETAVDWLANANSLPTLFLPQSHWLDAHVPNLVAFPDMAAYVMSLRAPRSLTVERASSAPRSVKQAVARAILPRLAGLYADDMELFATLKTWSPHRDVPMTLYGICQPCMRAAAEKAAQANEAVDVARIDGTPSGE